MDKDRAKYKFREADTLYRQRRYEEALVLLAELNDSYPGTRRIQFPLARTLARLERYPEAIELLDQIVQEGDYEPASILKSKLNARIAGAPTIDLSKFDEEIVSSMGIESTMPPPLPGESSTSSRLNWILGFGLAVVFAVLIIGYATLGIEFAEWYNASLNQPESAPPVPLAAAVFMIVFNVTLGFIAGCVGAYCALAVVQALAYPDFEDNLKDIALYNVFWILLLPVIVIGWIAFLIILKKHYELRFGSLIVVVFVYLVISSAIAFGLAFAIGLIAAFL